MARFVDEYAPDDMPGYPCVSVPRWSTRLVGVDSGDEQANQRWAHPLFDFTMPEAVREQSTFNAVYNQWLAMRGPYHVWPFRDPLDFASVALDQPNTEPVIAGTDQTIGTGDNATTSFQLTKTYTRGSQTYDRKIELPIVAEVLVLLDGADPAPITWSVSRPGGIVTFSAPIPLGVVVTAGFLFDVPVRFESDDAFEGIVHTYAAGGYADLKLVGMRSACL